MCPTHNTTCAHRLICSDMFALCGQCVRQLGAIMAICTHTTALIGAALLTMAGMHEARAQSHNPGCMAAQLQLEQGGFNGSVGAGNTKISKPIAFTAGDTLKFHIVINNFNSFSSGSWALGGPNAPPPINTGGTFDVTFIVQVNGATYTETIIGEPPDPPSFSGGTTTVSFTCTSNPNNNAAGQKARTAQIIGSKAVGLASGAAITGAIDSAIADGLNGSRTPSGAPIAAPTAALSAGAPFGLGAGSEQMNLGRTASPRVDPPSAVTSEWKPWLSVHGSGWDQDDSNGGSIKGNQINATFGLGNLIAPNVLIGVVGGYENFNYHFDGIDARLQGDGLTAGAYAAWAFTRTLRFDVKGAFTALSYNDSAGAAAGSFDAKRWLVSTGITGTYGMDGFVVEPSSRLYALRERQDAWTDSLGTSQAERSFSIGRLSTGAKVGYLWQAAGTTVVPYVGLYGDYRFSSGDALPVNQPFVGLNDGWSARVTTGAAMVITGGRLSLEGELGDIGSGDRLWSISVRGSIPFY
jgi:hypothetical protein